MITAHHKNKQEKELSLAKFFFSFYITVFIKLYNSFQVTNLALITLSSIINLVNEYYI